jgi:hypothetical protein
MKKFGLISFIAFLCLTLNAQKYEIKVKINGISDTVIYLGHHFGEKKYVIDTARIDSKGNAIFTGDKELNRGIYLVVMPSKGMTYFEILVADQKRFSVETDTLNFVENLKIKGCKENLIFNQYQKKMSEMQIQRMDLNRRYEAAKDNEAEKKKVNEEIIKQNQERLDYMDLLVKDNPNTFFSKVLLGMKDVVIPEPPRDANGVITDSAFQYKYFKAHYFDYIDFKENGLLRTPILEGKVNYFFDKMVVPTPDSLIKESHILIERTYEAGDTLMFQWMASHLLHYFEASKIMGYDAVFVAIAEDWYLNGKATWADTAFLAKLNERVEKITPNKIGNVAPDLTKMQTNDEKYMSLSQVAADYTILVFYEPSCGHCKKEVPKLMQEYNDTLKGLNTKIFAVYTQYDKTEWQAFIDEHGLNDAGWYNVWDGPYPHSKFRDFYDIYSTPVIFVLDKDKKIIAKRINVENLKDVITFENKKNARGNK